MKKFELKSKIILGGVLSILMIILGFSGTIWFAITLWELNPMMPGAVAFVIGGALMTYKAVLGSYKMYFDVLAAEDMAG